MVIQPRNVFCLLGLFFCHKAAVLWKTMSVFSVSWNLFFSLRAAVLWQTTSPFRVGRDLFFSHQAKERYREKSQSVTPLFLQTTQKKFRSALFRIGKKKARLKTEVEHRAWKEQDRGQATPRRSIIFANDAKKIPFGLVQSREKERQAKNKNRD